MNRRQFIRAGCQLGQLGIGGGLVASTIFDVWAQGTNIQVVRPGWTNYQMTINLAFSTKRFVKRELPANIWIPLPSIVSEYQRLAGVTFSVDGVISVIKEDPRYGAKYLHIESPGNREISLNLQSNFRTSNRTVNLSGSQISSIKPSEAAIYTRPTQLMPKNTELFDLARQIVGDKIGNVLRGRLVYDWVVDNFRYDERFPGQGSGDVHAMLLEKDFSGGSVDISSFFVGLMRILEIPARLVVGLWVGKSRNEFPSLGLSSPDATAAQYCRAEFFDQEQGWIPVDTSAVGRAIFYDSPKSKVTDPKFQQLRDRCFGSWDMNWVALNYASEISLPGSRRGVVPFFMYPNAETSHNVYEGSEAQVFPYSISIKELI